MSNSRKVKYQKDKHGAAVPLPRASLSQALRRSLKTQGSAAATLNDFQAEIDALIESGSLAWLASVKKEKEKKTEEFKKKLLKNLQEGKTNIEAGGRWMDELVGAVLQAQGYDIEYSPSGLPQGADADIVAIRKSPFGSREELLIQTKNRRGQSDAVGVAQLVNARSARPDFSRYKAIFITSAWSRPRPKVSPKAIISISGRGEKLVDLLFDSLDKMDDDIKFKLGIYTVPSLFSC